MNKVLIRTGSSEPIPNTFTYMTYPEYKSWGNAARRWPKVKYPFLLLILTPVIRRWNKHVIRQWYYQNKAETWKSYRQKKKKKSEHPKVEE